MPRSTRDPEGKASNPLASVPVIEMKDVAVGSMQDVTTAVIRNINWRVAAHDDWVIGGLQGSGKSDLLAMTASLMAPAEGSYQLFGETMPIFDEARLDARLRLGLVFETGQLFNHLTVRENIGLPLRYHKNLGKAEVAARVDEFLEALELGPYADSTPGAMARSWQKRVGLGRALILEPELVMFDNPLASLDLRHLNWWLSFLDDLSRGHKLLRGRPATLVVTTADLRPWRGRKQQFAILKEKRFTVLGTWAQVEAASAELLQELITVENPK